MLIKSDHYRRNRRTGDIVKRQKVVLECDDCGIQWQTNYDFVKRKRKAKGNDAKDYCVRCRMKPNRRIVKTSEKGKKIVICLGCRKKFWRIFSKIRKNNFCSLRCRDSYNMEKRYGHLYQTFDKNPNEISYLFGLILGDGHLRKLNQQNTTRISIGFDVKYDYLIKTFEKVAHKLKIEYFIEPRKHSSCQAIGFVLPDNLLEKYGMLWNGAKYDNQPIPVGEVVNNINFAVGLINSDGWCGYNQKKYRAMTFVNTTYSIVDCFEQSLRNNDINFSTHSYKGKKDKRTGNVGKDARLVRMTRSEEIDKLIKEANIKMKDFR